MEFISQSLEDTAKFTYDFVSKLRPAKSGATVVGLHGDLGSGKTTLVQCAAKSLGIAEKITSPTFVIQKRFKIKDLRFKFTSLIHIDAYRLKSGNELLTLGFLEILKNDENIVFIEWPERVEDILPADRLKISFEFVDENTRKLIHDS